MASGHVHYWSLHFYWATVVGRGKCRIPNGNRTQQKLNAQRQSFESVSVTQKPMRLCELLSEANVVPISVEGDKEACITGITEDSREVIHGDMFVCCIGQISDGHHFVEQAISQGAGVVVACKQVKLLGENVKAVVIVKNTNAILSALSGAVYGNPSSRLSVVGITGTNGKTTTSYLVKSIYEAMGLRTGLVGTIEYYMCDKFKQESSQTTPNAVDVQKMMATMVQNGASACVMEVSSHALVQDRCAAIDFDISVFTNLSRDHMDYHETEEDYRQAKGKLFEKMVDPHKHIKVVNIDDSNAAYFISKGSSDVGLVTYGLMDKTAHVHALQINLSLKGTHMVLNTPLGEMKICSPLIGRHNVYNVAAAVAAGIALKANVDEILNGIERVDGVPGRCQVINDGDGDPSSFAVIVDYAHTPDALARLLETLRECKPKRLITVIGCGGDRDRGKRALMAKIAAEKSEISIFTSDNPRTEDPVKIIDDMLSGIGWATEKLRNKGGEYIPLSNGKRVYVCEPRKVAIRMAIGMGEEGDAIVVAGKGHEKYQIVGREKKYHDDSEECRRAITIFRNNT